MSDFDDLFKESNTEKAPENNVIVNETIDNDYYFSHQQNKVNLIMFIAYVGVLLLVTVFSALFIRVSYPGFANYGDNISFVEEPEIFNQTYQSDTKTYTFNITIDVINNNDEVVPTIWVNVNFYDENDQIVGSYYDHMENVQPNQTIHFEDSIVLKAIPDSTKTDSTFGYSVLPIFNIAISLLQVVLAAIAFFFIDFESYKRNFFDFTKNFSKRFTDILVGFITVFVVLYIAQFIMQLLGITGTSENEMTIRSLFEPSLVNNVMLFLLLCVFTPIVEETIFRKVIFNFVDQRLNYKWAIGLSGFIFGFMHVVSFGDFVQSIPYVAMGMVFGYFYYRSKKNIFVTIGMHFLNNLITFVIYVLVTYGLYQF